MAESRVKSTVSLKLLIDTHCNRVIFAEAGKDFVDFLFHILSLPVGTVISLLRKQGMAGSLTNLYGSIEVLNDSYIQPNQTKDTILKTVSPSSFPLLAAPTVKKFYSCSVCVSYVSDDVGATCPYCFRKMNTTMSYVAPGTAKRVSTRKQASGEGGFVKGVATYMVTDDLEVNPISTISIITLLNKFNIKGVGALEERVVNLGMDEAVKLLNASLQSKKVLTDVFLIKGIKRERMAA